jgi:hypothetical protein
MPEAYSSRHDGAVMRAALVTELGRPPHLGEAPEPATAVEVLAAPVNPLDRAIAAGVFYGGHPPLPYVPGSECVGREADGTVVWTSGGGLGRARNGSARRRGRCARRCPTASIRRSRLRSASQASRAGCR